MSDVPENVEQFNFATLAILDALYTGFPIPAVDFHPATACLHRLPKETPFEDAWHAGSIADATLTWLAAEGFVTIGRLTTPSGGFGDVRLTLKGLALLGSVPGPLVPGGVPKPLSQRIKGALSSGTQYVGAEAIKAIVGDVIKFGVAYAKDSGLALMGS
jgi:hypothetical protein